MIRLQQLRIDSGLSARQLSRQTGVSTQTILNIEQGNDPWPATLKTLGDYFGVPASALLLDAIPHEPTSNGEAAA